jgi:hypothetical protein
MERDIPWLQDMPETDIWSDWDVVYRDVIVLDADNHPVAAFNLTTHDISVPSEFEALRELLLGVERGTD